VHGGGTSGLNELEKANDLWRCPLEKTSEEGQDCEETRTWYGESRVNKPVKSLKGSQMGGARHHRTDTSQKFTAWDNAIVFSRKKSERWT